MRAGQPNRLRGRPPDGGQRFHRHARARGRPGLRPAHRDLAGDRHRRQLPRCVLDVPGDRRRSAGALGCGAGGRRRVGAAPAADRFPLEDAGSGIDPASLRVLLDGIDVAPPGRSTGLFAFVPAADWFGSHELRVLASDRSGNAMAPTAWGSGWPTSPRRCWATPGRTPVRRRPTARRRSLWPWRTPAPASTRRRFAVTVDGREVSRPGSFAAGRLTYVPRPSGAGRPRGRRARRRPGGQPCPLPSSGTSASATRRRRRSKAGPGPGRDRSRRRGDRLRRRRRRLRHRPGEPAGGRRRIGRDRVGDVRRLPVPLRAGQPRRGRPHDRCDRRRPLGQPCRPGDVAVRRRQPGDRPPGRGVRADPAGVRPLGDDRARRDGGRPAAGRRAGAGLQPARRERGVRPRPGADQRRRRARPLDGVARPVGRPSGRSWRTSRAAPCSARSASTAG